jgi:hypothetical protein
MCPKGKACPDAGKHPRTRHGVHAATTDPQKIQQWEWESANIGIATGLESGLLVLDNDPREGGNKTLIDLEDKLDWLPQELMVQTGGGGWHYYVQHPGADVQLLGSLGPGLDVKSEGGYVVAPPSEHKSGTAYKWLSSPEEKSPPDLPEEWLSQLARNSHSFLSSGVTQDSTGVTQDSARQRRTSQDVTGHLPPSAATKKDNNTYLEAVNDAIKSTLPTEVGTRHDCAFKFARALKAITELRDAPVEKVKSYFRKWHELALPFIVNAKDFENDWWDFAESWDKVRYPKGEGLMTEMLELAMAAPVPEAAKQYENESVRLLVSLCRELQRHAGDAPFFLSSHLVAKRLEVTPMRAWRWLKGLCGDGVLELVQQGNRKEANEYRYLCPLDE